jgi:predicted nucleotidyltransferase
MKYTILNVLLFFNQILIAQSFTEVIDTPFEGVWFGSSGFSDVDGDMDEDLFITGLTTDFSGILNPVTILYINDGGTFVEAANSQFEGVWFSAIAFSDVDLDGDEDVLITGQNNAEELTAILYYNENGEFTQAINTPFEGYRAGDILFSDVDLDGDEDLFLTGTTPFQPTTKLFLNESGIFSEVLDTPFQSFVDGSIAELDIDSDGDHDVIITGLNNGNGPITKIYVNENGNFSEFSNADICGVWAGAIALSDIDSDNDSDIIISGINSEPITKMFINEDGIFIEELDVPLPALAGGTISFFDVDGDFDDDLLLTGGGNLTDGIAKLFTNNQGIFTEVLDLPFDGVVRGTVSISDVDSDGDYDILITGSNNSEERITKLYLNDNIVSTIDSLKLESIFRLNIYPNPIKANNITIYYDSNINELYNIKLINTQGQTVYIAQKEFSIGSHNYNIKLPLLSKGCYFMKLSNNKHIITRKILIN